MAYQAIGKIAMTPRGNWVSDKNYQQLDIVTHQGNIYIALNDIAKNIPPELASSNWQLLLTTEQVQGDLNNQINQLQNVIDNIVSNQQTLDKTINIIKNIYGAPAKASSVDEMIDTNRVYVYTGTTSDNFKYGFWYYYNGSAWNEGGQYNSIAVETDSTLTLEGVPADAKATGELKTAIETFYPHATGAGAMVTVKGTVDAPPAGLTIYGRSVQDGTPAPDAPVDIVTAGSGGTLSMVSAAKNLLRKFVNTSGTGTGCSWTFDAETGTYTLTSTVGSGSEKVVYGGEIGVRNAAGQTLTLSAESITGDSNASVRIHQGDNQLAMIYGSTLSTTFRVPNEEPLTMTLRMGNATAFGVTVVLKGVQLEVGSARTDFAPMLDKLTAAIPTPNGLPGIPVARGGNYVDSGETRWICDTIDLEAGVYTKRCGVVTLDGSENWQKGTSFYLDGNDFYAVFPGTYANAPGLCNMFIVVTDGGSNNGTARFAGNGHQFLCYTSVASTVSEWKAVLNNTHMTIVYPLAAPEVVQLTTAQLTALRSLRGRKGQTNLYSADPAGPEIAVEIYINFQNYIQSIPNKFRICSWNIGNFAYGDLSGGTDANSNHKSNTSGRRGPIGNDTMYDQMINAFNESQADIYLFCEWNRYWNKNWTTIDTTQDIEAMTVLEGLKPYWTSHNPSARADKYAGHKIASNWPIIYEYAVAYGNDEDRYFVGAVCSIAGREVHFVSVHFNPNSAGSAENIDEGGTSTAKTRRREFKILQDYLTSIKAKYIVLAGDFNLGGPNATAQTALNDLQMLKDAGYTCMQGGFFGKRMDNNLFDTLNADEWPRGNSSIRPYDNIAISNNMRIINAQVIAQNGSDHYPIIADIVFKDDKN